ncbi:YycH family regulatory protein [Sutcliffiella deserti]|uniref:YycH family regulatory protein n=1 Tax=Sutcliffiella deserti TaxID=2875501 RepID=UPI001CBD44AF|nr:two-component system activity regulator YycH [Sutcliffiella deserti]
MKYENLKSLILTILVLSSLVLTWNLWTYQPDLDYIHNEELLREVEISEKLEVKNIIRPTKMLFHYEGTHYGTSNSQEISRFIKEMEKWSLYDIENISTSIEQERFTSYMHTSGKMEVVFPAEVPLETLRHVIGLSEEEIPSVSIDRILIDINSQESDPVISLVNYDNRRVYTAKVNNMSISSLKNSFYQPAATYEEYVSIQPEADRYIFVPEGPVEITQLHYISNPISPEEFKDALFNAVVTKDRMSVGEVYTDGQRIMSVDRNYSLLQYVNTVNAELGNSPDLNVIESSIDFVNEHSGWTRDKYLFAGLDQSGLDVEKAVFRLYVGDYPVFNREGLSEISQVWRNNEVYSYTRPIFELRVPITTEQKTIVLPSVTEVKKELMDLSNFDFKMLKDIGIGYRLKRDIGNQGVYILEPIWVYQDNNGWFELAFQDNAESGGM